jgi:hypothetical protein
MDPVTLYEGVNFSGLAVPVGEGNVRFTTPEQFNDSASSIRVTPGYCAVLYEHANEHGGYGLSVDLLEDCPDLSVDGFDKLTSYVRVSASTETRSPGSAALPETDSSCPGIGRESEPQEGQRFPRSPSSAPRLRRRRLPTSPTPMVR